jgi:hypothetical protein
MNAQSPTITDYSRRSYRKHLKFRRFGLWCLGLYVAWSTLFFTVCLIHSLINK